MYVLITRELVKIDSDLLDLGWVLRFHICNKLPGDTQAAGLSPHLKDPELNSPI